MIGAQMISQQEINRIKEEMLKNAGVDLEHFKTPFLTRRINARMMATGVRSGSEYAVLLASDPLEPLSFYNSLSINVTECFRDPKVWDIFMTEIIPKIIQRTNDSQKIRIWSAGCATGQEPYSIAMMFLNALGTTSKSLEILATDMNKVSISIAKTGKYDQKSLKNIPHVLLPKYIKKLGDELYGIRDELKQYVKFYVGDISSFQAKSLDVLVCRNLLIYYGKEAQELLFKKFYNALNDDGYLILGMDESMIGTIGAKLFKAIHPRQRIFQKKLGALS